MDAAIPADAQNAPTGIWKSRTEREIPTAPTPIIVVVNERKNNGDSNSVAKPSTESDQAQWGSRRSSSTSRLRHSESDDRPRPTSVVSHRQVRILLVGIVRAGDDSCNNARPHRHDPGRPRQGRPWRSSARSGVRTATRGDNG